MSTLRVNTTGLYPRVQVDVAPVSGVGQAGGVLLTETVRATGLDQALSAASAPGRRPLAQHDSGKVLLDLALALAPGGDCLADVASVPSSTGAHTFEHHARGHIVCLRQL